MAEELNSLAGELDVCVRKSDELRKKIPAELLRKYEQIKNAGRGVAVVSVWKEVCDGCHMSIPPQLYNELQKSNGPDHLSELQPDHLLGEQERLTALLNMNDGQ